MKLQEISFPVFKLRDYAPQCDNGEVYYSLYHKDTGDEYKYVVDDTKVAGDTLAKRRLRLTLMKVRLQKLTTGIFFLGDLIKLSNPKQYFIDSSGKVFKYTKSRSAKLICRRITKVVRIPGAVLIEAEKMNGRYIALYPPLESQIYASFLELGAKTYILYGFSDQWHEDKLRRI